MKKPTPRFSIVVRCDKCRDEILDLTANTTAEAISLMNTAEELMAKEALCESCQYEKERQDERESRFYDDESEYQIAIGAK